MPIPKRQYQTKEIKHKMKQTKISMTIPKTIPDENIPNMTSVKVIH
jgi:hypothetical protein